MAKRAEGDCLDVDVLKAFASIYSEKGLVMGEELVVGKETVEVESTSSKSRDIRGLPFPSRPPASKRSNFLTRALSLLTSHVPSRSSPKEVRYSDILVGRRTDEPSLPASLR